VLVCYADEGVAQFFAHWFSFSGLPGLKVRVDRI
jgi:hypothetical protein